MSSLYAKYLKEYYGKEIVEDSKGFATYYFPFDTTVYIEDIYVLPQHRKTGVASAYADRIAVIAKERGCRWMLGSVDGKSKSAQNSRNVLIAFGMVPVKEGFEALNRKLEFFVKEI